MVDFGKVDERGKADKRDRGALFLQAIGAITLPSRDPGIAPHRYR
jgi:hypothetical protein